MLEKRRKKLQSILKEKNLGALLVSNFYNILYMTGFKTLAPEEREAFVVVTDKNVYLISGGRYISKIKDQKANSKTTDQILKKVLTPEKRLVRHLEEIIRQEKIKLLGFEAADLKFHEHQAFKKKLSVKLIPTERIIAQLRTIKDQQEIVKIKRACKVADQCLREIIKTVKVGQTEKEIAFKIEFWLKEKGYDVSFQPIVAVDKNAAIPHYNTQTGKGKIKHGSLLLIDFGAKVDDYCSDTTRVFFVGKPKAELVNVYNKLLDVQERTIRNVILGTPTSRRRTPEFGKRHPDPDVTSGEGSESNRILRSTQNDMRADSEQAPIKSGQARMTLKSVDEFCRNQSKKNGLPNFPHSTGHGVGLEVHESPSVSFKSKDKLQVGQVFTIEPGIYIEGKYGMRIEDMIWVKDDSIEILTKLPKQLSAVIL